MISEAPVKHRWLLIWSLIVLVGMGVICVGHALWVEHLKRKVEAELDDIRALGLPATHLELDAWYRREPPVPNAADAYDQAFARLVEAPEDQRGAIARLYRQVTDPPMDEAVVLAAGRAYVATNAEALVLLREVRLVDDYYRPLDLKNPPELVIPRIDDMLQASRLLAVQGRLAARDGRFEVVTDNLALIFCMGRHLSREPLLISQLIAQSYANYATGLIEGALNDADVPPAVLQAWSDVLAEHPEPADLKLGLLGELAMMQYAFAEDPISAVHLTAGGHSTSADLVVQVGSEAYCISGIVHVDRLSFLEHGQAAYVAADLPFPARLDAVEAIDSRVRRLPRSYALTRMIWPAMGSMQLRNAECVAGMRCAISALAVERHLADEGVLPATIEELCPQHLATVPADPFTGGPLLYTVSKTGYTVYSAGRNRKDDGGVEREHSSSGKEDDIVFRVERARGKMTNDETPKPE